MSRLLRAKKRARKRRASRAVVAAALQRLVPASEIPEPPFKGSAFDIRQDFVGGFDPVKLGIMFADAIRGNRP